MRLFRIKELSKILKLSSSAAQKIFSYANRKRFYCYFDNIWFEFNKVSEIIVPSNIAERLLKQSNKYSQSVSAISERIQHHKHVSLSNELLLQKIQEIPRIPVVAILGHFDHGKTTLLDKLGGTNLLGTDVEGVTQVVRTQTIPFKTELYVAYNNDSIDTIRNPNNNNNNNNNISQTQSDSSNESDTSTDMEIKDSSVSHWITFVDTPGQDFFFRMRNYGASIADMAVLVVSIDEGVCSQTQESIGILESLGIPAVVAINKIDKYAHTPDDLNKRLSDLRQELKEFVALDKATFVPISAKVGTNINVLKQEIIRVASSLPSINTGTKYPDLQAYIQDYTHYIQQIHESHRIAHIEIPTKKKNASTVVSAGVRESYRSRTGEIRLKRIVKNKDKDTIATSSSSSSSSSSSLSSSDIQNEHNKPDHSNENIDTTADSTPVNKTLNKYYIRIKGSGTVLNLWSNKYDGTALHMLLRYGQINPGDYFVSAGWTGQITRIYEISQQPSSSSTSSSSSNSENDSTRSTSTSDKVNKDKNKKSKSATTKTTQISNQLKSTGMRTTSTTTSATTNGTDSSTPSDIQSNIIYNTSTTSPSTCLIAGLGMKCIIKMDENCVEPRPLGETIYIVDGKYELFGREKDWLAQEADQAGMAHTFANHALSEELVQKYRLHQLIHGNKEISPTITIPRKDDHYNTTVARRSPKSTSLQRDDKSEEEEEDEVAEVGQTPDGDTIELIHVVLKTDTDLVLGTLTDILAIEQEEAEEGNQSSNTHSNTSTTDGAIVNKYTTLSSTFKYHNIQQSPSTKKLKSTNKPSESTDNPSPPISSSTDAVSNILTEHTSTSSGDRPSASRPSSSTTTKKKYYKFNIVNQSIGTINNRDVLMANASKGYIFAFNVTVTAEAAQQAQDLLSFLQAPYIAQDDERMSHLLALPLLPRKK